MFAEAANCIFSCSNSKHSVSFFFTFETLCFFTRETFGFIFTCEIIIFSFSLCFVFTFKTLSPLYVLFGRNLGGLFLSSPSCVLRLRAYVSELQQSQRVLLAVAILHTYGEHFLKPYFLVLCRLLLTVHILHDLFLLGRRLNCRVHWLLLAREHLACHIRGFA